jgi:hypothetical protein
MRCVMCNKPLTAAALRVGDMAVGPKCAAKMFTREGRKRMTLATRRKAPKPSAEQMALEFA